MASTKELTLAPSANGYKVSIAVPDPVINTVVTENSGGGGGVNKPPVANAGDNVTVTIAANALTASVVLNGTSSYDPDGTIRTYGWRKTAGGPAVIASPSQAITNVSGMTEGNYTFELRVTDQNSVMSYDLVTVTVKKETVPIPVNRPPVANAGGNQTVLLPLNKLNLDGSLSYDPDGQIKGYQWTKVSGPSVLMDGDNTAILKLSDLVAGSYVFRLTIMDNSNATNSNDITVVVKPEVVVEPPAAATYPFNLTQNKASKMRHFAGFENWNGQNYASFTGGWKDYYFRFCITDIVKGINGTYDWTRYDNEFKKAIAQGAGMSIGFMLVCDSDTFLAREAYDGATSRYPEAWHKQMQAENVKDFIKNGMWIPNWNSPSLHSNLATFFSRVTQHNNTTSFNGVYYKDIINYVDIRLYAQWGEWHNGGLFDNVSQYPAGTRPSVDSYKKMIDVHCDNFPDYPLVVLFAGYDANWLPHTMTPPEVTYYLLTKKNKWGYIGWRRDQWGQTDNYIKAYLEENFRSYADSGAFNQIIMERWKFAPVVGEPYGPGANLADLKRQVLSYHTCSLGNGNMPQDSNTLALFKDAAESAGAKISLNKGQAKLSTEFDFDVTMTAENFGNCPVYNDRLNMIYEMKDSSGKVVWSANSAWKPLLKQPGSYAVSDRYKITTVPTGSYSLSVVIKDNYRALPLFNDRQSTDGVIVLATGIKF